MKRILILLMSVMSIICLIGFCGCNLGDSTGKETKESSIFNFYFATENSYGVKLADDVYLDKISIPSTYNGRPVNTILKNFLGNNDAYRLKELVLPSSIKYIEADAFKNCSFTKVDYKGNVNSWCEIEGVKNLMNHLTTNGLYINGHLPTSIDITTATKINDFAFYGCTSISNVFIGDTVINVGSFAFADCTSLESVVIGNSVTSIADCAFLRCSSLNKVYYFGDSEDWEFISITSNGNDSLTSATRYYYSETQPQTFGNYWHYDIDGKTVLEW